MRIIIVFDKVPVDADETQEILFGDRKFLVDPNCSCNFDQREEYPEEHTKNLDVQYGEHSFYGIVQTSYISDDIFNDYFKDWKNLTRENMIIIVKDYYFESRPSYTDFLDKNCKGEIYSIKWKEYFEAENKAVEDMVDNFIADNKNKYFLLIETDNIILYGSALSNDNIHERFPHLKISNY